MAEEPNSSDGQALTPVSPRAPGAKGFVSATQPARPRPEWSEDNPVLDPVGEITGWTTRLSARAQDLETKVSRFFTRVRAA